VHRVRRGDLANDWPQSYAIDTGRSGQGPPDDFTTICNPPGRGLGFDPAWDAVAPDTHGSTPIWDTRRLLLRAAARPMV
jgi:hypothetical protein